LFNRRYLEESVERELSRAQRRATPLSVVMLDIDHFKRFNDTFGHQVGDEVLKQVAHVLSTEIRTSDLACRFGGEEFTLILPDAEAGDAARRADHIRQAIAQLPVSSEGKTYGQVTVSFGVASYPVHGSTLDQLIEAADAALYQAKSAGRNRVEVAPLPSVLV
jgi:diguanylate cyclase (GGDEF)-like protein